MTRSPFSPSPNRRSYMSAKLLLIILICSISPMDSAQNVEASLNARNIVLRCGPFNFSENEASFIWSFGQDHNGTALNSQNIFLNKHRLRPNFDQLSVSIDSNQTHTSSILTIQQLDPKSVGIYRCDAVSKNQSSFSYRIRLFESPKIVGFNKSTRIVSESDNLLVNCSVKPGIPESHRVYWHKIEKDGGQTTSESELLNLTNVQAQNSGLYECVATNDHSQEDRAQFILLVKYSPRIEMNTRQRWLYDDSPLKLSCGVTAFPEANISWTLDNSSLPSDISLVQQSHSHEVCDWPSPSPPQKSRHFTKKTSILMIPPDSKFEGLYRCEARNSMGSSFAEVRLNARPSAVESLISETVKYSDACLLKWNLSSGTQIHHYTLELRQLTNQTGNEIGSNPETSIANNKSYSFIRSSSIPWHSRNKTNQVQKDSFVATKLSPNSSYQWRIRARNKFGSGQWSKRFVCQTVSKRRYIELQQIRQKNVKLQRSSFGFANKTTENNAATSKLTITLIATMIIVALV